MIKEYVLSMDELIEKYPLGSKHLIGDEKYIVREHIQPMASTNMASYPAIRFDKISKKEGKSKNENSKFYAVRN